MKASDFVARYLEARGVTHTFELVGGMITHLLDSLSRQTRIRIVSCHHEQGAAFAAEGYGRITGVPGVALATSGPGATNLLTGIGSCFFDSTPAVFLTGQVNTHELKGERGIRQLGFQETDIVSMARPICKWAVQVSRAEELPAVLTEAFRLALEGRPGPCLVDLPMNVQAESIPEAMALAALQAASALGRAAPPPAETLEAGRGDLTPTFGQLFQAIREAQRPLLLLGGGCAAVPNRSAALQIAEILHIPTVLSLMGVDVLPHDHPQRVGFIGSYGNRWANKVLGRADLLVVVGSRLDIRQTGSDLPSFCAGKQIWQIDIDPAEMGVRLQPHRMICCSIPEAARVLAATDDGRRLEHPLWTQEITHLRSQFPAAREYVAEPGQVNPVCLLQELSALMSGPCQYITDVGQHQMWAAQSLAFAREDRFLTSGGMGAMGFGLPAAIGAALARPDATTVLISGDGGFQVNIQELETVRRNHLPLKILLFNNRCHGMVRQFQETYFVGNLQSTAKGYSAPDFVAVGQAYAIPSSRLPPGADTAAALRVLLSRDGPALLDVPLPITSTVYPKLAFGRPFGDMEPDVAPTAIEST
ncbi:MAG: thiamine pyrophosphate-binding protein [Cyanobacteriota bacterium]|nr:thiamine pyrophosphate-binding protein [Cyanobacteriota bacterium]